MESSLPWNGSFLKYKGKPNSGMSSFKEATLHSKANSIEQNTIPIRQAVVTFVLKFSNGLENVKKRINVHKNINLTENFGTYGYL